MSKIRPSNPQDIDILVELWLQESLTAHPFIDAQYWRANAEEMKTKYLPMADTIVIEEDGHVAGFVSMVDDYLAALFIDSRHQKKGLGKGLLDHVKQDRTAIRLQVYRQNERAVRFYEKQGFRIEAEMIDEATSAEEYRMVWMRNHE
ncbi:N-acetyltransferase [Paenibacillus ehimensis]|uniref:N-acetyltransferase n=1 Tax=Paenibacillus ehimensis TaxID=79264 RepID=A0ABT8VC46_9BACL|nr:N-acetyltransferase [Paenibacillus ehimensis]MDO3678542.1 N-acetyltransferase [Paenibacillus ehimensis]MEC0210514.1 N-acetyltransferase [Paenibacillus ehimensis]